MYILVSSDKIMLHFKGLNVQTICDRDTCITVNGICIWKILVNVSKCQ